ncbi:hypothetical protein KP509_06G082200 [Ceratopteris richardii]|nr:hypothetical protein KP509_06G082200 [Ceratopteris richardii]
MKLIWVRKGEQPPALPQQFPSRQANHVKRRTKQLGQVQPQGIRQVWVPKKLVAAQQGKSRMWVTKALLHAQNTQSSLMRQVSIKMPRRGKGQNQAQSSKKDQITSFAIINKQSSRIWVWKPKAPVASIKPKSQLRWIKPSRNHPNMKLPKVITTQSNTILKWIPIRRNDQSSSRDPMDTSRKDYINIGKQH